MFKNSFIVSVTSALLLTMAQAYAAESAWKGSVELGVIYTSGNTENESVNAKSAVEQTIDKWRNSASLEALNIKSKEGRTAEKYVGNGKSAYQFGEHSYAYVSGSGERDLFSGYDYQASVSAGYGYRAIGTEKVTLDLEIGPGYRQVKLDNDDAEGEAIGRLSAKYENKLSKTSTFGEELTSEIGSDATITKSITTLSAQVNGDLAMKISLTIKNNSNVPAGVEETDTETAVTLVYSF